MERLDELLEIPLGEIEAHAQRAFLLGRRDPGRGNRELLIGIL